MLQRTPAQSPVPGRCNRRSRCRSELPRAREDDRRKPPSAGAGVRRIIMTADQDLLTAAPHRGIL